MPGPVLTSALNANRLMALHSIAMSGQDGRLDSSLVPIAKPAKQ